MFTDTTNNVSNSTADYSPSTWAPEVDTGTQPTDNVTTDNITSPPEVSTDVTPTDNATADNSTHSGSGGGKTEGMSHILDRLCTKTFGKISCCLHFLL